MISMYIILLLKQSVCLSDGLITVTPLPTLEQVTVIVSVDLVATIAKPQAGPVVAAMPPAGV